MEHTKESMKRMLGWLLCMAMLLAVLPSNLFMAEAAEKVYEGMVTVEEAPIYSCMDPAEENIVGYAKMNTVFQLSRSYAIENRNIPSDQETKGYYEFYEVYYEVNDKTEKCYILSKHMADYGTAGVNNQPSKANAIGYISGLAEGETAIAYDAATNSQIIKKLFSNGFKFYMKDNQNGWSTIYFTNSSYVKIETKYLTIQEMLSESKKEGMVTVNNSALYSAMDSSEKNVICRLEAGSVIEMYSTYVVYDREKTVETGQLEQFYEVNYKVNGKTQKCYILYGHVAVFKEGVKQPKNSTVAYVSGLKEGQIVKAYSEKKESNISSNYYTNGAKVFVKESSLDGWTSIYVDNTRTRYIKTEYLSFDKEGKQAIVTAIPTPTPKPVGTKAGKPVAKTTMRDVALYDSPKMEKKVATVQPNTLLNMVSTKKITIDNPGYAPEWRFAYEVEYTIDGKKVICYVQGSNVNVFENGVNQPDGTIMRVIQGYAHNDMIDVIYDGKVIGFLMNDAEVYIYQQTSTDTIIEFNGVKAHFKTNTRYIVTATPTPTPTPTLSPVKTVKEGEYEVAAKGTLVNISEGIRNNPADRTGSQDSVPKVNTILDIVSLELVPSIDAKSENIFYYKVAYKGTKGLGYYYIKPNLLDIHTFGQMSPNYLVDGIINRSASTITEVRSSTSRFNSSNIIIKLSGNTKIKIDPTFEDAYWTRIYINNQYAYVPSKYVAKTITPAKDVLAADQAGLAKAYPDMEIIAQAYLVGTDSVVQATKIIEISPIEEYDVVQNEWIDEKYVPQSAYLAYEAATLSVVDYDDERVVFWSNGYQLDAADAAKIDPAADVNRELHTAGFYQVPRDMVLLDLGNAEVAKAGETVETVAEAMATANIGLNTSPEMSWDGYEYVVPQNSRVKLVSTEKIPAIDGSNTMYYKVALKLDSPTGYLNKENVSYYYVDSAYVNVFKNTYTNPSLAKAGVVKGLAEGEKLAVYAKNNENSEIIGYLTNGAEVDYVQSSTKWKKIVFNSKYAYVQSDKVGNPKLDKTGIPDKLGVTDVYFSQGGLYVEDVYPNIEVIGMAKLKSAEVEIGIASPYTVIQGQRIAARYFPDWNIANLKTLYDRYVGSTAGKNFQFMSEKMAYLELGSGALLEVVAYNDDEIIFWSPGYRSFTSGSLLTDCRQYKIQLTHPAGFYSLPRTAVDLITHK